LEEDFIVAKIIIDNFFKEKYGIIDVGSHEGDFVRFITNERPAESIIMIEPLPDKVSILRERFKTAKIYQCAISDSEQDTHMYVTVNFPKCSALYERQAYDEIKVLNERTKIDVKLRPLTSVLDDANMNNIDVNSWYLKVDTEGYELETIRSAEKYLLSGKIKAGQFEYGGCWKERGLKINDMIDLLNLHGFTSYRAVFHDNDLHMVEVNRQQDDYQHTNIFFIKK